MTWARTAPEPGRLRLVLRHNGFPSRVGAVLAFTHKRGWRRMVGLANVLAAVTS